jgi:hypothetical protein
MGNEAGNIIQAVPTTFVPNNSNDTETSATTIRVVVPNSGISEAENGDVSTSATADASSSQLEQVADENILETFTSAQDARKELATLLSGNNPYADPTTTTLFFRNLVDTLIREGMVEDGENDLTFEDLKAILAGRVHDDQNVLYAIGHLVGPNAIIDNAEAIFNALGNVAYNDGDGHVGLTDLKVFLETAEMAGTDASTMAPSSSSSSSTGTTATAYSIGDPKIDALIAKYAHLDFVQGMRDRGYNYISARMELIDYVIQNNLMGAGGSFAAFTSDGRVLLNVDEI